VQEDCVALQEDEQEAEGDGDGAGEDRDHDRGDGHQAHGLHRGTPQVRVNQNWEKILRLMHKHVSRRRAEAKIKRKKL